MIHWRNLDDIQLDSCLVTIGTYDGVHRGHQAILKHLLEDAHQTQIPAVVVTFYPHPAVVLGKRERPVYLTSPNEKALILGEFGINHVITLPFSLQTAALPAREFIENLYFKLHFQRLYIGYDFALGKGRTGDAATLRNFGLDLGYEVEVIPAFKNKAGPISSSRIRDHLIKGEVESAAGLLGRPYSLKGKVVPGDGRGKTIGIPTANLEIWPEKAIPTSGVYVCKASVNRKLYIAVVNIGVRPTFESDSGETRIEAHILDYEADIYGQEITLEFISYIRSEKRFTSVDSLVTQIRHDIKYAREKVKYRL